MGDWTNLAGTLIQIGLPQIGGLLMGPLGSAGGKLVGSMIAGALGVSPTPEAISAAVQADPAAAQAKLSQIEANARQVEAWAKVQIAEIEDAASARSMNVALAQTGSWAATTPAVLTYLVLAVFTLNLIAIFFIRIDIPDRMYNLLSMAMGAELAWVGAAVSFWWGSTRTSQKKDETISKLSAPSVR